MPRKTLSIEPLAAHSVKVPSFSIKLRWPLTFPKRARVLFRKNKTTTSQTKYTDFEDSFERIEALGTSGL